LLGKEADLLTENAKKTSTEKHPNTNVAAEDL
jgi:hypothetical protein